MSPGGGYPVHGHEGRIGRHDHLELLEGAQRKPVSLDAVLVARKVMPLRLNPRLFELKSRQKKHWFRNKTLEDASGRMKDW